MDAFVKGFLQGSIPTIVLVGGTHYLVKGFKVSRPVVYWGSLAVAAGLTYAVVQGKIKAPFMNAENSEPYYEVMVDSSSLDNLADEFGDGLVMEIYDLRGHVLSLDYGAGGDEPLMTPTKAKEDYMGKISITTYDYEPDADEETGEWFGTPNTNIWRGTINFPEGKQREGGEFSARVFGFNESEFPIESHESQEKVERIILDWVNRTVEVYVRELGEDGNFHTLYDAETFGAEQENKCPDCGSYNIGLEEMDYCYSCDSSGYWF